MMEASTPSSKVEEGDTPADIEEGRAYHLDANESNFPNQDDHEEESSTTSSSPSSPFGSSSSFPLSSSSSSRLTRPRKLKQRSTSFLRSSCNTQVDEEIDILHPPSKINNNTNPPPPPPNESTSLLSSQHSFYQYHPEHSQAHPDNIVPLDQLLAEHLKAHAIFYAIAGVMLLILVSVLMFLWRDLGWQAWYSAIVIFITFLLLIKRIAEPAAVMLGTTTMLLIPGVITPSEALQGFSNSGVFSIAVLFVVAAGIAQTGLIRLVADLLLGEAKTILSAQLRLFPPCCFLSAFTNNTPLCALLLPVVEKWCRDTGAKPSKLLMPLSFSLILGGTCTIIGTSTNLVVVGLATLRDPDLDFPFFEIGEIGVPIAVVGLLYIFALSMWLLPDRESPMMEALTHNKEFTVILVAEVGSPCIGSTLSRLGIEEMENLSLIGYERNGDHYSSAPNTVIRAGDRLILAGDISRVKELASSRGLKILNQDDQIIHPSINRVLAEAVLAPRSPLIGHQILEIDFEKRFQAAVIAVARAGKTIKKSLRSIKLKPGDTLLIVCKSSLLKNYQNWKAYFVAVNMVDGGKLEVDYPRMILALLIAAGMIICSSLEITSLLTASLVAAFLMLLTGCLTFEDAAAASNLLLIVMIAASFGMATAMEKTGLAAELANTLVEIFEPLGNFGVLYGVYVATATLTAVLTNASSAALMIPIVFNLPQQVTIKAYVYAVMIAASADFSTPIGYQTNFMVWGPGGYHFTDYPRFGFLMQVVLSFVTVTLLFFLFT